MKKFFTVIAYCFTAFHCSAITISDGYTDKSSYRFGDVVTFYINANGTGLMDINLTDLNGVNASNVNNPIISNVSVYPQSIANASPWMNGYGYSITTTWTFVRLLYRAALT